MDTVEYKAETYNIYSVQPTDLNVTPIGRVMGKQVEIDVFVDNSKGNRVADASGKSHDTGRKALNFALENLAYDTHIQDLPDGATFESRSGVTLIDGEGILVKHRIGESELIYFVERLAEAKGLDDEIIGAPRTRL